MSRGRGTYVMLVVTFPKKMEKVALVVHVSTVKCQDLDRQIMTCE